ncbi:hypothetical protein N7457_003837 [Penicillium paradoxum]|uniref:uncharacterized protein n=1 Tax=Penicillium paradoxum TaxID=176176 RepID=UPI002548698F|nr:uncharacterized protein N7457_003837 [Penicillium paradoxum]KAJ5782063.1 hypothetical protein N7457_003837 [Penicillium paradoxum]
MALVRDPCFWKRFSTAVHMDEEAKVVDLGEETKEDKTSWLSQQHQKRKRSIIWGFVIFFALLILIIAGVVVWWLAKNNWLQPGPDATT